MRRREDGKDETDEGTTAAGTGGREQEQEQEQGEGEGKEARTTNAAGRRQRGPTPLAPPPLTSFARGVL